MKFTKRTCETSWMQGERPHRRAHPHTAALLGVVGVLGACGYKAAPSPLFDEQERFGDVLRARQKQEQRERDQEPNPGARIHWPQPQATPTPQPKPENRRPEQSGTR